MAIPLNGAVACVTGGARGIGRATVEALARAGAHVTLGDIDIEAARAAAGELGRHVRAVHLDVRSRDSFERFLAAAEQDGPITLLVNNAGIMRTGRFFEQDADGQDREIAINLGGVVNGMRSALPTMVARNQGHIVNLASMAGKMSVPGAAVYTATKFAVTALSRSVRSELHGSGVTITTILPAAVRTELTAGLDTRAVPTVGPEDVAAAVLESCTTGQAEITLPRWLAPIGAIEAGLPESVGEFVKRSLGAQRRISIENEQRRAYRSRA